jgi:hypothetical protein
MSGLFDAQNSGRGLAVKPFGNDICELPVRVVKRNNRAERQNRLHKLIHDTVD